MNTKQKQVKKTFTWLISIYLLICFSINSSEAHAIDSKTIFGNKSHAQRFLVTEELKEERIFECPSLTVPAEFGNVIQHYKGKNPGLIIHIQDRHADEVAQLNIASIIDVMESNYDISLLCLEGAVDWLDTSFYDNIPDTEAKRITSRFYVKEGLFTGAEYYKITNKDKNILAFGVEDKDLYFKHAAAYKKHNSNTKEIGSYLKTLERALNALKPYIFSKSLKEIDDKRHAYEDKMIGLNEFTAYIAKEAVEKNILLSKYPNLKTYSQAVSIENTIDFKKAESQRDNLIKILSDVLKDEALSILLRNSIDFKLNKISAYAYYEYIEDIINQNKDLIDKSDYKELFAYIDYIKLSDKVDNIILFDEIEIALKELKGLCYADDTEKLFDDYIRYIELSIDLYDLKLTEKSMNELNALRKTINMSQVVLFISKHNNLYNIASNVLNPPADNETFKYALDYYELALKRDRALISNTLRRMAVSSKDSSILVAGGFHTQGIVNILKQLDISYIVVCPKIGSGDYEEIYQRQMNNQMPPADAILDFISSMVVHTLYTGNEMAGTVTHGVEEQFFIDQGFMDEVINVRDGLGKEEFRKSARALINAHDKVSTNGISRRRFLKLVGAISTGAIASQLIKPFEALARLAMVTLGPLSPAQKEKAAQWAQKVIDSINNYEEFDKVWQELLGQFDMSVAIDVMNQLVSHKEFLFWPEKIKNTILKDSSRFTAVNIPQAYELTSSLRNYVKTMPIISENIDIFENVYQGIARCINKIHDDYEHKGWQNEANKALKELTNQELYLLLSYGTFELYTGTFNLVYKELVRRLQESKEGVTEWLKVEKVDEKKLILTQFFLALSSRNKIVDLVKDGGNTDEAETLKEICFFIHGSVLDAAKKNDKAGLSFLSSTIQSLFDYNNKIVNNYVKALLWNIAKQDNLNAKVFSIIIISKYRNSIFQEEYNNITLTSDEKRIFDAVNYLNTPSYSELLKNDNRLVVLLDYSTSAASYLDEFKNLLTEDKRYRNRYTLNEPTAAQRTNGIEYVIKGNIENSSIAIEYHLMNNVKGQQFKDLMETGRYSIIFTRHHSYEGQEFAGVGSDKALPQFVGTMGTGKGAENNSLAIVLTEALAAGSEANEDWDDLWIKMSKRLSLNNFMPPNHLSLIMSYALQMQNKIAMSPAPISSLILVDGGCGGINRLPKYYKQYEEAIQNKNLESAAGQAAQSKASSSGVKNGIAEIINAFKKNWAELLVKDEKVIFLGENIYELDTNELASNIDADKEGKADKDTDSVKKSLTKFIKDLAREYPEGEYRIDLRGLMNIRSEKDLNDEKACRAISIAFHDEVDKLTKKIPVLISNREETRNLSFILSELASNSYDAIASFYDPEIFSGVMPENYTGLVTISFNIKKTKKINNLVIEINDNGLGNKSAETADKFVFAVRHNNRSFYNGDKGVGSSIIKELLQPDGTLKRYWMGEKGTKTVLTIPLNRLEIKKTSSSDTKKPNFPQLEKTEDAVNLDTITARIWNPLGIQEYMYFTMLGILMHDMRQGRPSAYIVERGNIFGNTAQVTPKGVLEFFIELPEEVKTYLILDISKKELTALLKAYDFEPSEHIKISKHIKTSEEILDVKEFIPPTTKEDRKEHVRALIEKTRFSKLGLGSRNVNIGVVANPVTPQTETEFNAVYHTEDILKEYGVRVAKIDLDKSKSISLPRALHALVSAFNIKDDRYIIDIILPPIVLPQEILDAIEQYRNTLELILQAA
jgi:hypothetical protein